MRCKCFCACWQREKGSQTQWHTNEEGLSGGIFRLSCYDDSTRIELVLYCYGKWLIPVEGSWAVAWTASWKGGRTHTFGPGSMSFCLIFTVVSMNPEQLPMSSGWEGRLVGGVWLSSSSPSSSCSCFPSSSSSCSSSSPSLDPTDPGGSSFRTA